MKIGVYVGSFNPVHKGHMNIVKSLLDGRHLNKVIMIPTLAYWDKLDLAPLCHRVAMLKYYETDSIIIDDTKAHFSYTYEIMNALHLEYPEDELYLIIGADNMKEFHKWKNVEEILKYHVIVIPRDNIDIDLILNNYKNKDKFTIIRDFKSLDISSTYIRDNIKKATVANLLDTYILDYIIKNHLY